MKKKTLLFVGLIVLSLIMVTACTSGNPVKKDLESYLKNEFPAIMAYNDGIAEGFRYAVEEDGDAGHLMVQMAVIDDVQPASEKFLDYLNGIEPATLEVFDAHRHMVEAIITQVDAYADLLMAIAWSDSDGLIDANIKLGDAGLSKLAYTEALMKLAEKYGVEFPDDGYNFVIADPPVNTNILGDPEPWYDFSPNGSSGTLQFTYSASGKGYFEPQLGEFDDFVARVFTSYDVNYDSEDDIKYYGVGHEGYGYALNVRYITDDPVASGGEPDVLMIEIVSMVVSETPDSGGFLIEGEKMVDWVHETFGW